ncbi:MAG: SRPBCC family protein [Nocardioidaceae bacterium]|jgi:uncharacterized protein YndB with AHSA1/START domain|nr:SRPBCC family protein [Nocardioidaceae bacterium]MBA3990389.1 SRPBCC family protein [Propionibacteriales bacterium]
MTRFEHSVVIGRPIEAVWAYLIDPANNPAWQGPVIEVRRGAGVPLEVGSEIEEVMQFLGRRFDLTWVVTALEPMRRSAVRTSSGPVPMQGSYSFEPVADGTRFTLETEMEAHGFFKLAEPVFARMARREGTSSCEMVKELLEADATTVSP